jgi:SMODS and SLOG-associating 2TM effector domain family 5
MSDPAAQPRISPRIVSSIEDAMVARRRAKEQARPGSAPADQLLHAMHTVKTARFTAAERLERKHLVSVFALSTVSLYFVGLSVWQTVYGATLGESATRLVTIVSIMSSICTLVLALIDSMNDYKIKAHHMHACALAVNDLLQEMRMQQASDVAAVQEFRRRYNDVVRGCPYNHRRVDYVVAQAERSGRWEAKLRAQTLYALDVYGFYGACLLAPPLMLLLFA